VEMEDRTTIIKGIKLAAAAMLLSAGAFAQQTFFNVPEAEATPRKLLYFQEQVNMHDELTSETTFTLGLGKGWELGINAKDVIIHTDGRVLRMEEEQAEDNPKLYLNARKSFEIAKCFDFSVGTLVGSTIASTENMMLGNFSYANTGVCWGRKGNGKLVAGGYHANKGYTGDETGYGYMAGAKVPLLIFNLQADYISGTSDISYLAVGGGINLPRQWELSGGVEMPAPGSRNPTMFTVQLSNR
jgi:hypothetical protein